MKNEFEKGDIVRCKADSYGFSKNKLYVVRGITNWGSLGIIKDDRGSRVNGWVIENFELISKSTKLTRLLYED